jgi:hypothetical protein
MDGFSKLSFHKSFNDLNIKIKKVNNPIKQNKNKQLPLFHPTSIDLDLLYIRTRSDSNRHIKSFTIKLRVLWGLEVNNTNSSIIKLLLNNE